MKLETILAKYAEVSAPQVGAFEATLSPDGWEGARYENTSFLHLKSGEVSEFTSLANSFFHECKTQADLKKFLKKHGTEVDNVTVGLRFDCALMTYIVLVSGYSAVFMPYRKENA